MIFSKHLFAAFLLIAMLPALASAIPISRLTLNSQPGDFIGGGGQFDIIYDDGTDLISAQVRRTLGDGSPAELLWVLDSPGPDNKFALVSFGTDALGVPIQPGVYLNAERADFASPGHPGLDISFQNRGSNTLTGRFTIFNANFSPDSQGVKQITSFDASFEEHSEGAGPALFGTFQYNVAGIAVPEPSTVSLVLLALPLLWKASQTRRSHKGVLQSASSPPC
ncbi:MAG: hypothetical protein U0236_15810 [Nitrospira sp.]